MNISNERKYMKREELWEKFGDERQGDNHYEL